MDAKSSRAVAYRADNTMSTHPAFDRHRQVCANRPARGRQVHLTEKPEGMTNDTLADAVPTSALNSFAAGDEEEKATEMSPLAVETLK